MRRSNQSCRIIGVDRRVSSAHVHHLVGYCDWYFCIADLYSTARNSLSGNFVAKSSAAFSAAAGSSTASPLLYASNSGWVFAAGGRFPWRCR